MAPPVSSSPKYPVQPIMTALEETQPTQGENNEAQQPSLQDQFDDLIRGYERILRYTAGCGSSFQGEIDSEYALLVNFTNEHPEFKNRLPKKRIAEDDGTGGLATGMAIFAAESHRRGEECLIQ